MNKEKVKRDKKTRRIRRLISVGILCLVLGIFMEIWIENNYISLLYIIPIIYLNNIRRAMKSTLE